MLSGCHVRRRQSVVSGTACIRQVDDSRQTSELSCHKTDGKTSGWCWVSAPSGMGVTEFQVTPESPVSFRTQRRRSQLELWHSCLSAYAIYAIDWLRGAVRCLVRGDTVGEVPGPDDCGIPSAVVRDGGLMAETGPFRNRDGDDDSGGKEGKRPRRPGAFPASTLMSWRCRAERRGSRIAT